MRAVAALFFALAPLARRAGASGSDEPPGPRRPHLVDLRARSPLYSDPEHGWEKAYVNSPLTSENSLWTEPGARAEMRIGPTTLRLDEATQLDIRRLDDDELRAHVVRGRVTRAHARASSAASATPSPRRKRASSITAAGRYRLDAEEDRGESVLTVFSGAAQVEAGRQRHRSARARRCACASDGEQLRFRTRRHHALRRLVRRARRARGARRAARPCATSRRR